MIYPETRDRYNAKKTDSYTVISTVLGHQSITSRMVEPPGMILNDSCLDVIDRLGRTGTLIK